MADDEAVDTTADYDGSWETERYDAADGCAIAQVLFDTGVMYLVNAQVLHVHGFALGVTTDDEGKVSGLNLHRTDDPKGIWFDEATTERAREKLVAHGLILAPIPRGCPQA